MPAPELPAPHLAWQRSHSGGNAPAASLFSTIVSTDQIVFAINKEDGDGQFYDFRQGVDGGLINVGAGPVVTPPTGVPEPGSLTLLGVALAALGISRRRKNA